MRFLRWWHMTHSHPRVHPSLLLLAAIAFTLFLYFIDEGRYTLDGLFTLGNALAMSIYLVGMVGGLFAAAELLARLHPSPVRTLLVLLLGAVLGLLLGLVLITGLGSLQHIG